MNILFHSNQLCERGTETALFDYAVGNEEILKNKSFIVIPEGKILCNERYEKWILRLPVLTYKTRENLLEIIKSKKIDIIYEIEAGDQINPVLQNLSCPVFVHAVFTTICKHGDYYIPIHSYLNKKFRTNYPVLPHICHYNSITNENLRQELKIPKNAIVYGCYGGGGSFSIPFVQSTVINVAKSNSGIYFIFMNINEFTKNENQIPNIKFLPGTTDEMLKEKFINTCNAMLHARIEGETFGLAIAEFAMKNKPVISFRPRITLKQNLRKFIFGKEYTGYDEAHIMNLGNKGVYYYDSISLENILINFSKWYNRKSDYDVFSIKFSFEKVMKQFNKIILNKTKKEKIIFFKSDYFHKLLIFIYKLFKKLLA